MRFDSLAAAMAMDGHGVYVWFVVAVTLLIVMALLITPIVSNRRILVEQRGAMKRAQREQELKEASHASGS